jgi:hypothetical protein
MFVQHVGHIERRVSEPTICLGERNADHGIRWQADVHRQRLPLRLHPPFATRSTPHASAQARSGASQASPVPTCPS